MSTTGYAQYFDNDYYTFDEIEDAYFDGLFDETFYNELLNLYYINNDIDDDVVQDKTIQDKPIRKKKSPKRFFEFISYSNSYLEYSDHDLNNTSQFIKFQNKALNHRYDIGLLTSRTKRWLSYDYDSKINKIQGGDIKDRNILDKFYLKGFNRYFELFIIGNYKARFGLGLTFSDGRNSGEGFYPDDELPYSRLYRFYKSGDAGDAGDANDYIYKRLFTNNDHLRGIALKTKYSNIEFNTFYSKTKIPVSNVIADYYDSGLQNSVTVSDGGQDEIVGVNIVYESLKKKAEYKYKTGIIFYNLDRVYEKKSLLFGSNAEVEKKCYGLYNIIHFKDLTFKQESSMLERNAEAHIIGAEFKNRNYFEFKLFFRDYDREYFNPFSNSLSLHNSKRFFQCRDERGYRIYLKSVYPKMHSGKRVQLEFRGDIYSYFGFQEYDSNSGLYKIVYGPKRTNGIYFIKMQYINKGIDKYELNRKVVDNDVEVRGVTVNNRKSAYNNIIINYLFSSSRVTLRYNLVEKNIDLKGKKYYGDSISILYRRTLKKRHTISSQIKLRDPNIKMRYDERFSYNFVFEYLISRGLKFKFKWMITDRLNKDKIEDTDYIYLTSLNRWRMEIKYKW